MPPRPSAALWLVPPVLALVLVDRFGRAGWWVVAVAVAVVLGWQVVKLRMRRLDQKYAAELDRLDPDEEEPGAG